MAKVKTNLDELHEHINHEKYNDNSKNSINNAFGGVLGFLEFAT